MLGELEILVRGKLDQLKSDLQQGEAVAEKSGATMADKLSSKLKAGLSGKDAMGVLGAGLEESIGGLLTKVGDKLDQTEKQLHAAADAAGISEDELADKTKGLAGHMENLGHTNDQTNEALRQLVQAGRPVDELQKDMTLSADLAAAKHISLSDAASLIAKVYGGNSKVLKQFGIDLKSIEDPQKEAIKAAQDNEKTQQELTKVTEENRLAHMRYNEAKTHSAASTEELRLSDQKLAEAQQNAKASTEYLTKTQAEAKDGTTRSGTAIDELAKKLNGQAKASVDTFGGRLEVMKTKLVDVAEHVGAKVGPALVTLGPIMMGVSTIMSSGLIPTIISATVAAGPWLLAIGALIAIGVLLWKNWDTITHALSAAWHWVEDEASSIWGSITRFFEDWWPVILGIFTGGLSLLVGYVVDHWSRIVGAIEGAVDTVKGVITRLPGDIMGWLGDLGSLLWDAGKALIQGLVNGIKAGAGAVMSAVGDIAKSALHAVTHPWEIFSPSRVTSRIGGHFAEGLALGIESKGGRVSRAASGLLGLPSMPAFRAHIPAAPALRTPPVPLPEARFAASVIGSPGGAAPNIHLYLDGDLAGVVKGVRAALDNVGRHNVSAGIKTYRGR